MKPPYVNNLCNSSNINVKFIKKAKKGSRIGSPANSQPLFISTKQPIQLLLNQRQYIPARFQHPQALLPNFDRRNSLIPILAHEIVPICGISYYQINQIVWIGYLNQINQTLSVLISPLVLCHLHLTLQLELPKFEPPAQ